MKSSKAIFRQEALVDQQRRVSLLACTKPLLRRQRTPLATFFNGPILYDSQPLTLSLTLVPFT